SSASSATRWPTSRRRSRPSESWKRSTAKSRGSTSASRSSGRPASAEKLPEVDRGLGPELGQGALARRLVRPPAQESDPVPEAIALEAVEADLADQLGAQRFPCHALFGGPPAGASRGPAFAEVRRATVGLQQGHQLPA